MFRLSVHHFMLFKIFRFRELLHTYATFKGCLWIWFTVMLLQRRLEFVCLLTIAALKSFSPMVFDLVCFKKPKPPKYFCTFVARMGFLDIVYFFHVSLKNMFKSNRDCAFRTLEGTFSRVTAHMPYQQRLKRIGLVTYIAYKLCCFGQWHSLWKTKQTIIFILSFC